MKIQSGRLIVELNDKTGELERIVDGQKEIVHLDAQKNGRNDARLFRVIVPRDKWFTRYIDSHEAEAPKVEKQKDAIVLHWQSCRAAGEATGVSVEVRVESVPKHEEVRFTMKVMNNGAGPAIDVMFPVLGGYTHEADMTFGGFRWAGHDTKSFFPRKIGTTYGRSHQCFFSPWYAPWIDFSGTHGGISYIVYMTQPKMSGIFVENLAGYEKGVRLAYGFLFQTVVQPGETWTSPPVGISVHNGDLRDTADRYREWANTWFTPPPGKRTLRESIGYQNVFLRGFDGTPIRTLNSIPSVAATGRKYGVDQLSVWDYISLGNYNKQDDLDLLDYTPEEYATLAAGLRKAREEGTNVNALINFRLCPPTSTVYL